jgi:hypothetical protein
LDVNNIHESFINFEPDLEWTETNFDTLFPDFDTTFSDFDTTLPDFDTTLPDFDNNTARDVFEIKNRQKTGKKQARNRQKTVE